METAPFPDILVQIPCILFRHIFFPALDMAEILHIPVPFNLKFLYLQERMASFAAVPVGSRIFYCIFVDIFPFTNDTGKRRRIMSSSGICSFVLFAVHTTSSLHDWLKYIWISRSVPSLSLQVMRNPGMDGSFVTRHVILISGCVIFNEHGNSLFPGSFRCFQLFFSLLSAGPSYVK